MTECEGDHKCPYCKGDTRVAPERTHGACREAELEDQIRRLTTEVSTYRDALEQIMKADKPGVSGLCGNIALDALASGNQK